VTHNLKKGELIVVPAMTPHWMKETKNIQYYVPNSQK
jgi:quercetin dioxygenase-like cupin family protein